MGKQYNKAEKKTRRLRLIDRKKTGAKAAAVVSKPKLRKAPAKAAAAAE